MKLMASATGMAASAPYVYAGSGAARGAQPASPYQMNRLVHGVCYYPELWPKEDVDRDIVEMKKLGINLIRIGEFAWSSMEPQEGNISTRFFRDVMDKFHDAGISVVFCTPTPTPPRWLTYNHPDRLFVNADGERLIHGARQHVSYEHPAVREASFRIIKAIAQDLGDHPALVGWQIDNELKCHVAEDFSPAAVASWHRWLKERFGTIERLNEEWGTHIWSTYYNSFEQVPAPFKTPFLHNASLSTAYRMFNRERIAEFSDQQCEIIRQYSKAPITHNTNPAFSVNHERLFENLDFASYDAYPSSEQWDALVFRSDMYRAAKPGRPFWLMETSVAHNGWLGNHTVMHPPGYLAAEASLVYAMGGEGFCYWLWRQQRTGAEIPHSAVLSSWYKPSIGYSQVEQVGRMRQQMEPLLVNSQPLVPEIAVTWSDHARAMIETEPMDKDENFPDKYQGVVQLWHKKIFELGYHREVRFEGAALDGLKFLITPAMPYVSEEFLQRVIEFVKAGGIWLAGPGTGMRGREHSIPTDSGLGLLDDVAGVSAEYVFPLTGTGIQGKADGKTLDFTGWCAALKADHADTRVLGTLETELAPGTAFLTERRLGKGKVVLLSAHPSGETGEQFLRELIQRYARELQLRPPFEVSAGTVVAPRVDQQGRRLWIAVNMDGQGGRLDLPSGARDASSGEALQGSSVTVAPYGWKAVVLPS
ncbi:beta-galactosidase [Gilvimarinus xylanilyticus]|uniref:Beta-galactosidase n=1 Tax=Gilvimarinus xylanilyticus TaxID=2944139 RepID=A0A9X2KT00_9GAMM|nr:beta-galactosidase [Gilvimarinus xylanilyticus]MCP8898273.1 beta-galactosidase [Gilvimarinus xylanilyticus]